MKSPIPVRVTGFIAAVLASAVIIGWTERHAWHQADQLQTRFEGMKEAGYHVADHLEAGVLRLNSTLLRFDLREDPVDRARFQADAAELKEWIGERRLKSRSETERGILERIGEAFHAYLASAARILDESEQVAGPGSTADLFQRTEAESDRVLSLGRELAAAQHETLQAGLSDAHGAITELKFSLIVSLLLLAGLSATLAILVYRGMIAPLRIKLMESRALLERQEKLASLGALAAGVAHEIRNPLTAIKARLFTQRKQLSDPSGPLEDNRFISEEIFRLDNIIKDFLHFARPSEPHFERVKATTPFRDLATLFRPELEKHAITLKCEFLADPQIHADPGQLKQVIINLVRNAAESIGRDGTITFRTRTQSGGFGPRTSHSAVLEVADTGRGIDAAAQRRIFDPFFTTKETGTGLGLSIAARILEKHNASLECQTEPGRGAVFSLVFPIAPSHEPDSRLDPAH